MKNLQKMRKRENLSQQQLADLLHTSQQCIYKYENDITCPNLEILIKMADFFETSVDYLIDHTDIAHRIEPLAIGVLNLDEKTLIDKYEKLSPDLRKLIQSVIDGYLDCLSK